MTNKNILALIHNNLIMYTSLPAQHTCTVSERWWLERMYQDQSRHNYYLIQQFVTSWKCDDKYFIYFFTPLFLPNFAISKLVVAVLSHRCNSLTDSGEAKVQSCESSGKKNCQAVQCTLNPEASRTNVSEETPYTWRPCQRACARPATQESLEHDGTRASLPAKPSPNPEDAGPILRLLTGLPVATQPGIKPGSVVTQPALP